MIKEQGLHIWESAYFGSAKYLGELESYSRRENDLEKIGSPNSEKIRVRAVN